MTTPQNRRRPSRLEAKPPRPPRGKFVAIEGGEGAGKSTLARALAERLRDEGLEVVVTREPGATLLGTKIREILLTSTDHPPTALAELLLYAADRAQHCATVIVPALARGAWVISDRFADSSVVYQGIGRGLGRPLVEKLNALATGGLTPDRTLLVDVPPELGLARAAQSHGGKLDRLESEPIAFHRKLRAGFLALARKQPAKYRVLDGRLPVERLVELAWSALPPRGRHAALHRSSAAKHEGERRR
jgi:dTMP kinase